MTTFLRLPRNCYDTHKYTTAANSSGKWPCIERGFVVNAAKPLITYEGILWSAYSVLYPMKTCASVSVKHADIM